MEPTTRKDRRESALEKLSILNARRVIDWEVANGAMGGISLAGKTVFAHALAAEVRRMACARDLAGLYAVVTGLDLVREVCGLSIADVAALAPERPEGVEK